MSPDACHPVGESQLHAEALEILGYVLEWQLPRERWAEAEQVVGEVAAAIARGDQPAIARAIADLELLGPVRIIRIGEPGHQLLPPPDPVRERVNRLIHALSPPPPPDPARATPRPGDHAAE